VAIDPSTIGSIEHQAEKLGYLISTLESAFQQRAANEKNETLVAHSKLAIGFMDDYLAGRITLDDYASKSAELLMLTTRKNDETNAHLANALNNIALTVQKAIEQGKLRYTLDHIADQTT
jgi:predicted RNA-binding protein